MARKTIITVPYRRRREGKTDYKKRLKFLTSGKTRLVVRRSLSNFLVQMIDYSPAGDKILIEGNSRELIKHGFKSTRGNMVGAYLSGYLAGIKAKKAKIEEVIVDLGNQKSVAGSRLYSAIKGVIDAGVTVLCDEAILPSDDRVQGKHIEEYAKKLKAEDEESYKKIFSAYIKAGVDPAKLSATFKEVKEKIGKV